MIFIKLLFSRKKLSLLTLFLKKCSGAPSSNCPLFLAPVTEYLRISCVGTLFFIKPWPVFDVIPTRNLFLITPMFILSPSFNDALMCLKYKRLHSLIIHSCKGFFCPFFESKSSLMNEVVAATEKLAKLDQTYLASNLIGHLPSQSLSNVFYIQFIY